VDDHHEPNADEEAYDDPEHHHSTQVQAMAKPEAEG